MQGISFCPSTPCTNSRTVIAARHKALLQASPATRPIMLHGAHITTSAAFDSLLFTHRQGVSSASMGSVAASSRTNDSSEPRVAPQGLNMRYIGGRCSGAAHAFAAADALDTSYILCSTPMAALLRKTGEACISLDQLALKAHTEFNRRFEAEPPAAASGKRKCSYCQGAVLPAHTDRRVTSSPGPDERK